MNLFGFMAGTEDEERLAKAEESGRAPRVDLESQAFNVALLRLTDGKGSTVVNLAAVTGLTEDAVKSRVKRARYDYEETDDDRNPFSNAELRYLNNVYMASDDPRARAFIGSINATPRLRPDWRSGLDHAPPRGKTQRTRRGK